MGTSVQTINEKVNLIASQETWIEGLAIQQLTKTAELAGMNRVAGMPDLHPGKGYPIGAAFLSKDKIYPALVGNDIGCGMSLWQTSLKLSKVNIDKMAKRLDKVEQPLGSEWQSFIQDNKKDRNIVNTTFDHSLGTIGGGNHFAEFQAVVDVFDQAAFEALNLDKKQLQLLVHSGSRGLGQSILVEYVRQFNHDGLIADSTDAEHYLSLHNEAVRWAELNRLLIAKRFLEAVKAEGQCRLDVNHNLVTEKELSGNSGWLHRKGATPSDQGPVIIPGSRGDYSYLVKPMSCEKSNEQALYSLAHGAGRKWKRGDCKARLSHKYKREDLYRTALGSRVICGNKELLYDEAPQAYKDCETIIDDLVSAGLVSVIAKLKPILTFKTQGECHS
ncbi:RNA ligase RtcB family protein [Alteromonadaceae bacterium M269]|nr:RNA ligase RtcB family protein [Alteromonadaceae bacterium M269]